MKARRFVFLDPDGSWGDEWLYVVVAAETGVVYQQQYGGAACRQGQTEGLLVPLVGAQPLAALRELFERRFGGVGTWNYAWSDDDRDRLRRIVGDIRYWASDGVTEEPHRLQLDESRLRETDEAWVRVVTSNGPGVLLWCNSD